MRRLAAVALTAALLAIALMPVGALGSAPIWPRPDATVDKTVSSNLWLTVGASAGAGTGTSFANRQNISAWEDDIGSIVVNANVNLTIVLESNPDGLTTHNITLGDNQVAGKTFTSYGGFYTVDSNNAVIHPGNTCAYRLAIGGTTSYKNGIINIGVAERIKIANVDIGQDASGNALTNVNYGNRLNSGYYYNCTVKEYINYRGAPMYPRAVFENCTFYGSNSGSGPCFAQINQPGPMLISCTLNTSGTYAIYSYSSAGSPPYADLTIVGGITFTSGSSIYLNAMDTFTIYHYRKAFIKATSDGSTALSGVAYGAYEATGGVDMPLSSGVTGADGLCYPESPTNYNRGIWALQKVETYIRTTAGAMTWGTPTSTDTYGNYIFLFGKSGYAFQTTTHDFTDGNDWGSHASPEAITMALDAPGLESLNYIATYDDAIQARANFTEGENVNAEALLQFNDDLDNAYVNTTLANYDASTEIAWWNDTFSFVGSSAATYADFYGGDITYNTTGNATGNYTITTTVQHSNITDTSVMCMFAVLPVTGPATYWNNTTWSNTTIIPGGDDYKYPAFFEWENIGGTLNVQFTDRSKVDGGAGIRTWFWLFGDGGTSSEQSPLHGYTTPGEYDVTLDVMYSDGSIDRFTTVVRVDAPVSWWAYAAISSVVMAGFFATAIIMDRKQTKRMKMVMYAMLALFMGVSIAAMQQFVG